MSADRAALDQLLESGMAEDAIDHARQVAYITSVLARAFESAGLRVTLVGGSAIELFAPGIFKTGDIDLVIEPVRGPRGRDRLDGVFSALGFKKSGHHWRRGDLFVEVPGMDLTDPFELVKVGPVVVRVVRKEILLADRVVGFKHWGHTAYGAQAIEMLAAFGLDIDDALLRQRLRSEAAEDAFEALRGLTESNGLIDEQRLQDLLDQLKGRRRSFPDAEDDPE